MSEAITPTGFAAAGSGSQPGDAGTDAGTDTGASSQRQHWTVRFGGYRRRGLLPTILFNIPTALMLLIVSLPFFLIIPPLILLQDGRPVFYKGIRMGRNKKPFYMYKFRTLVKDAEKRIGGELLSSKHRLETPLGKLLRETRLDELPQLVNVVRGEMNLVGPRPERPAVYEKQCRDIPNYDRRFQVKPGIIGYSQLFTPHSAPKRARAYIDNYYVRRHQKWHLDVIFFGFALAWLAQRAAVKSWEIVEGLTIRLVRQHSLQDQRASERVTPPSTRIEVKAPGSGNDDWRDVGAIVDISDEGLVFVAPEDLSGQELELRLQIEGRFPPRRGIKRKRSYATGRVLRVAPTEGGLRHVVLYEPKRGLDRYLIHQYFLDKSIA